VVTGSPSARAPSPNASACINCQGARGCCGRIDSVCANSNGPAGIEIATCSACAHIDGPIGLHAADRVGIGTKRDGASDHPLHVRVCTITDHLGISGGREGTPDDEDPLGVGFTVVVKDKCSGQVDGGSRFVGSRQQSQAAQRSR
jgi:hypothetical protein